MDGDPRATIAYPEPVGGGLQLPWLRRVGGTQASGISDYGVGGDEGLREPCVDGA